jgi:hypothetical protein
MVSRAMKKDRRTLALAFILGLAVFTVPVGMLMSRSPAVETTNFHMSPDIVSPGDSFQAVWIDTPLREGCTGVVFRRFVGLSDGMKASWVYPAVHVVLHGPVGEPEQFRTPWVVPAKMDPGTEGVFRKHIKRSCNFLQAWIWPMEEDQEARFTVK